MWFTCQGDSKCGFNVLQVPLPSEHFKTVKDFQGIVPESQGQNLQGLVPESQGQNLALAVISVPYSLDSGQGMFSLGRFVHRVQDQHVVHLPPCISHKLRWVKFDPDEVLGRS